MAANLSQERTLLSTLKEATFFVAIYLYFIGFVYIFSFYDTFGISLRSIDTPVYYFFVYSYNVIAGVQDIAMGPVLKQKPLWTLVVAIVVGCALIVLSKRGVGWRRIVLFGLLTMLFPFSYYVARATAKFDALKVRNQETAKEITFVFKKDVAARDSVRLVKEFRTGTDADGLESSVNKDKTLPLVNKKSKKPPEKKIEQVNDEKNAGTDAETVALQRFFDANKRIDIEEKREGNVTTLWPKLYLVTETSTAFYILLQPSPETGSLPYGYVYEIAKADVLLSEVKIPQSD
jgi:hypothetical protein